MTKSNSKKPKIMEDRAEWLVESLMLLRERVEKFPCPRCGRNCMNTERPVLSTLSRCAKVYICSECGMDEAMRDSAGLPPTPLTEWGMALYFMGR